MEKIFVAFIVLLTSIFLQGMEHSDADNQLYLFIVPRVKNPNYENKSYYKPKIQISVHTSNSWVGCGKQQKHVPSYIDKSLLKDKKLYFSLSESFVYKLPLNNRMTSVLIKLKDKYKQDASIISLPPLNRPGRNFAIYDIEGTLLERFPPGERTIIDLKPLGAGKICDSGVFNEE